MDMEPDVKLAEQRHQMMTDERVRIADLERQRAAAITRSDVALLRDITSADYVHVDIKGRVRNRDDFLATLTGEARFSQYSTDDVRVTLLKEVAIVTGRFSNEHHLVDGETTVRLGRFVRVWAWLDGRWRNVLHQATSVSSE